MHRAPKAAGQRLQPRAVEAAAQVDRVARRRQFLVFLFVGVRVDDT